MTPQPLQNIREFVCAGNAIFTIENTKTGKRFTYKVQQCEDDAALWFVKVLTGPDNESSYQYLGIIPVDSQARTTYCESCPKQLHPTALRLTVHGYGRLNLCLHCGQQLAERLTAVVTIIENAKKYKIL